MNIRIDLLNNNFSFGIMNPFRCSKPFYIKFYPMNKYGYNIIINLFIVYFYHCNLKDI